MRRAFDYPYAVTEGSFWLPPPRDSAAERGPHRLLAYGANRSREGLTRKLGVPSPPVAVMHGWLHDFDVVYSAHISPYGAVPATLQHSPGSQVSVHVLHLDARQLEAIDAAEPNYRLVRLEGIGLALDDGARLEAVDAYLSRHGCLAVEGAERALAAIRAPRRAFTAYEEHAILAAVRNRLAPNDELEDFVVAGLADPALQRQRTAALRTDARAFAWPRWRAFGG